MPTNPIAPPPSPSHLRDKLQSLVIADLLGPADGPDELVDERDVCGRYLVGVCLTGLTLYNNIVRAMIAHTIRISGFASGQNSMQNLIVLVADKNRGQST